LGPARRDLVAAPDLAAGAPTAAGDRLARAWLHRAGAPIRSTSGGIRRGAALLPGNLALRIASTRVRVAAAAAGWRELRGRPAGCDLAGGPGPAQRTSFPAVTLRSALRSAELNCPVAAEYVTEKLEP